MDQETARTLLQDAVEAAPLRGRQRTARRRPVLWCTVLLVFLVGLGSGLAVFRLSQGPWRIDGLTQRVAEAIASSVGPGWRVTLRDSALELDAESSLALRVGGLDVYNPEGALVVRAPLAVVSLDTWGLLRLAVQPRSIEFRDLQMTALVHDDGSIAFAASAPSQADAAKPHTLPSVDATRGQVSPISAAVASIFGVVLDPAGVIGALDRARITNGRLTLVDDTARHRAVFEQVNGLFHRGATNGARIFELRIDGPNGEWRFGGKVHDEGEGRRAGIITLDDLPVADLLLLSGQSKLPIETDLKLSAKADVALRGGRIESMKAEVKTGEGLFVVDEKDFNPVIVEQMRAEAQWDEGRRVLDITAIDYKGGGNDVHFTGAFAIGPAGAEDAWTFDFAGKDALLRGAARFDPSFRVGEITGRLTGRAGGVNIESVAVSGNGLNGRLSGTVGTRGDEDGLTLHILAQDTDGRIALRLWPENIAPAVRNYLVDELRGGRLDRADIRVDLSGTELAAATRGDPMPDHGLNAAFAVSDAMLAISNDAPPLSHGRVSGVITGRTTTIQNATAEVRLSDSRALSITEGAFLIRDPQPDRIVAQVGLRLAGSADSLAALLETRMFKGLTGAEIDPNAIRGRADLRIDVPINLKQVPDLADLPVTLSGTLTDLSLDKAVGKDRFESGRFAINFDRSGFALKGEGRMLGTPVAIDLRQPKPGSPGEAVVTLALDDAFRSRRGLPAAPQLAGTIPARIVVPIGRPASAGKAPMRVEADLTRAAIDGLLPGWSKAAGRAGRLTLSLVEGVNGQMELRDIALDAAPAMARGSATVSAEGGLERADFTSLKLSPGDDMRVSLDRAGSGYKVAVKGAVADARPFLKSLTSADSKGGKDSGKDIEAEIGLNILSGFNGESLTNATLKASLRGGDVRSAQFRGRFGGAAVAATVSKGERGLPLLALESADSGATLRFFDIYRRMHGGRLALSLYLNDGPQTGIVQIKDFALRNEPALSSIVAQGPTPADARRGVPNANDVAFDKMRANFTRSGSRVSFTDAAISNAAMGFTAGGWLDTAKERTQIDGTFVPLYGLNNVVAHVPLVGPLLAGGNNEGLFAVNFNVSGPIAKPTVNVNPLSAVAPGFLRKLFGAGSGDAYANGAPPTPER
ncbi:AsmA-like C-terminal region-containing protein [Methylobacterium sp. Leaf118]|uniref:AsmA-like C-terminal region-containing protein n=1 Tax=Methylobacterium sp. Leaf118 TaxID=2876562 RepID=UPI001E64475F|nr:AsmA-like C-terminal region-containing protein [Methylobacterium sp. Leaf118]